MPMSNPAPGFNDHPQHAVALEVHGKRLRVMLAGECIADSTEVRVVREADYPAVYYFPKADVRSDLMTASDNSTYCPFKGQANYWSIRVGQRQVDNIAWSYETPYDEMLPLTGHLSFYGDRVDDIIEASSDPPGLR